MILHKNAANLRTGTQLCQSFTITLSQTKDSKKGFSSFQQRSGIVLLSPIVYRKAEHLISWCTCVWKQEDRNLERKSFFGFRSPIFQSPSLGFRLTEGSQPWPCRIYTDPKAELLTVNGTSRLKAPITNIHPLYLKFKNNFLFFVVYLTYSKARLCQQNYSLLRASTVKHGLSRKSQLTNYGNCSKWPTCSEWNISQTCWRNPSLWGVDQKLVIWSTEKTTTDRVWCRQARLKILLGPEAVMHLLHSFHLIMIHWYSKAIRARMPGMVCAAMDLCLFSRKITPRPSWLSSCSH